MVLQFFYEGPQIGLSHFIPLLRAAQHPLRSLNFVGGNTDSHIVCPAYHQLRTCMALSGRGEKTGDRPSRIAWRPEPFMEYRAEPSLSVGHALRCGKFGPMARENV